MPSALRELFDQLDVPWLPACELFAPWYSYALAKYILEQQISPDGTVRPLRIVELGGRGGNTALHILDCLKVRVEYNNGYLIHQ